MSADQEQTEEVIIWEPDRRLKEKLGNDVTFDQIVTPQLIAEAEKVITHSAGEVLAEIAVERNRLEKAFGSLTPSADATTHLNDIIEAAFSIKSKAGFCGYPFASTLAKSLHLFCELDTIQNVGLPARFIKIVGCHVNGLKVIFGQKITGDGGPVGAAIMGELQKLTKDYK